MNCPANSTGARAIEALQPFSIKEAGREGNATKYRTKRRPWGDQSGTPSVALSVLIYDDGEHGAYTDHVDGNSGSLYQLAERMNFPRTPRAMQSYDPTGNTAYVDLADYCTRRGWPLEAFKEAGWHKTLHQGRSALTFPVATGERYRYIDGKNPKYKSALGVPHCLYGLKHAVDIAERTGQPLVLCNGEASTIVAQWYGVAAFCISGGEGSSIEKFIDELPKGYRYLIGLDCDDAGRTNAPKQQAALRAAGFEARAVDLNGGDKFDLADFATLHEDGAAAALLVLQDLGPTEHVALRPSRLIWADDLHTLPPTRWLIQGMIATNMLHQLFAPGGSGKSFIALDMALCVAQYAPVLYLAGEAIEDYKDRVEAWKLHHAKGASNLVFWNGPIKLADALDVQSFIAEVQTVRPALIVIDPLATCMVGLEESSTGDMTIAVDSLNSIRKATAAGLLIVHHTGWAEDHERGNSTLRAACRMVMKLTNSDGLIKLSSAKQNNGPEFEPRCFRLLPTSNNTPVPVPARDVLQIDSKLTQKQIAVLQTLSMAQFKDGASHTQICEDTTLGKSTVNRAINALLTRQLIVASEGRNKVYSILPSGAEELEYAAAREVTPVNFDITGGVNWQVNVDALVPEDAEQARNNSGTSPSGEASYTVPSSAVVPSLQAQVPPSSAVVPPDPELLVPCSVPSPPLRGDWMEQQPEDDEKAKDDRLPRGDFYHDARRIRNAKAHIAHGDLTKARSVASLVSGRKAQLELYAEIERAEDDAHQQVRTA